MKSFTKFFALMMAMLVTLGMTAQISELEYQVMQQKAQQEINDHGPTVEVPNATEGSTRAVGDDCSDPIIIDFAAGDIPFNVTGETTCGRGDNYEFSCMGLYDGGDDIHYQFINVPAGQGIEVNFDPVQTYSGLAIKDACGDAGDCLYLYSASFNSDPKNFTFVFVDGGTYYMQIDSWPSPQCIDFDLEILEWTPPPPPPPIAVFPYFEDFNDCVEVVEIQLSAMDQAHAVINNTGFDGTCGIMLDGNTSSGWAYSTSPETNWNNSPLHHARGWMNVEPHLGAGVLTLQFDFRQNYSFSFYYNVFTVTVDGVPIPEKSGDTYLTPTTNMNDDWRMLEYDLSAYQGADFELRFDNAGNYYYLYYQGGDASFVDNVSLFYKQSGDVEGYAYNEGVIVEGVEVGFLGDDPPYPYEMTDVSGYYRFSNVPTTPDPVYGMYAFMDGMNYVTDPAVTFITNVIIQKDWDMTSPLMVITPAVLEETMNPNEWRSVPITITNGPTGGPLHWTAEIIFGEPPTNVALAVSNDHSNGINEQNTGNSEASFATEGDVEPMPMNVTEFMDCSMEEPIFSAPPVGTTNGQAVDAANGWAAAQHYTLTDDQKIGFVDWWMITTGTPPTEEFLVEFYEDGGSPTGDPVASFTAFPVPLATGEFWSGAFQYYRYQVELPEAVDLEVGWFYIQRQQNAGNPWLYWANTTATSEPSWHMAGGSVGPYAMCLGGGAGGGWLDLSAYEGDVAPGESDFVSALFDASGTEPGQVWTADIEFTAQPNISTATVDVSMIIAGEPLVPIDELEVELVNMVTGQVDMSWSYANNDITFEYFLVRRNGAPVANTQFMSYTDFLPDYGEFCFTVSAVYTEGESVPAGPECVIWLIPELCYDPDPLYGEVWTGDSESFPLWLENCGEGMLSFEFTGFDDPDFSNGFVTAVEPYMGAIEEGEGMYVNVTFDAAGYGAGTYFTDLDLMTNELAPDNERLIACEMFAYTPATLYGMVTDCDNGLPLSNVTVMASGTNSFYGESDATGYYEFYVDEDTYDVTFSKLSYDSYIEFGVFAPQGVMTEVNAGLCETPYPVQWVVLDPNEADTQAKITWSLPMGPYEIIYDDGSAENYFAWIEWGGAVAVKFTPAGYPASVAGGRLFVGDGSYPEGANFLGAPMAVGIFDDDGPNGMPGTVLDSATVTVDNYGWVQFSLNGATFNDGNFYVGMWQITIPPFSPPVGIDEENPVVFRSYTKQAGMEWQMSSYNDFMIRAVVFGPGDNVVAAMAEGESVSPPKPTDGAHIAMKRPTGMSGKVQGGSFAPVEDQMADRDLEKYRVAFVDGFDPDAGDFPWDGTLTPIATTGNNTYNHNGWGSQPPGFYAYAVRAEYESSVSEWAYSNVAAHLLDRELTVNVVQCDGEEPSGALVTVMGHNYPYQMLSMVTPASGTVVFDSVIMGVYDLAVNKLGYQSWEWPNMVFSDDMTVDVTLQETEYPPRNLYVDPLTSIATWDEPLYIQVPMQGFEEEPFPPEGWQNVANSDGWERVEGPLNTGSWGVPAGPPEGGDWFAVAEDDSDLGDDCCTYLITPMCDLREASDYTLDFLYYFDGAWGAAGGFVNYSTDAGATWVEMELLATGFDWQQHSIDLADMSGPDGESAIWFSFQYDDGGAWASGFAVDNVYVGNGPVEVMGYHVYLDDGFVAETDVDTRTYQYGDLQYGTVYTASVAALYACNVSDPIYYTFTSSYLYPPRNLYNEYLYNTNEVPLFWNPPVTGDGVPMASAPAGEYVQGIYEPNAGPAPLNGVAVTEGETADPSLFNNFRAPIVYGVSNDIPAYASFDAEAPGTVTTIASWPGGGNFANASEIVTGSNGEEMYEVDNTGAARHINLTDGTVTTLGNVGVLANAMGLDYTSGIYYATDGNSLFTVDFDAVSSTNVGSLGSGAGNLMIGMTFDNNGDLYMYDIVVDNMWSCDKETGACTQIGSIGFDANFGQGMAWDQLNDQAVLSAFNSGSFACEYRAADLTTGNTTFLGNIGSPGSTQFGTICIPVTSGPGGGGDVPDGLMSFNVYQDMMFVGNQPYEGQAPEELVSYVHNPVDPGCYEYTVTAVYDLSVYGFPGETGESYHEGPDTACVVWGFDLPFMEDWTAGNLDFNSWTTASNNWMVSSANGNPEPAAQFNWDPDPGADYSIGLTSAPLKADLLTEGDIWMDFEFYLENRTATGEEKLAVEVYNGQEWMQVAEFANTSSYDWTFQHLKITDYAMSRVFQVRFSAMGMNSFDVVRWNVDNIHIYRVCEAPSELAGSYLWNVEDDFGAELMWTAPELPVDPEGWIRWDDGVLFSGVGLVDGGDFSVAARWDAGQLEEYVGTSITQVQLAPNDDGYTTIDVKIWTGSNASNLVYEATGLMPAPGVWTVYDIDPPVALDVNDELWIGYTVNGQPASTFPAGTDAGPAVAGYGDKITTDGTTWDNLSDFGLDYNWSVAAYVETLDGTMAALPSLIDDKEYNNATTSLGLGDIREEGVVFEDTEASRDFTGFNIYRMGPDDDEYSLIDNVAYEEGVLDYSYYDADPFGDDYPYEVCYQVTAVWESETDYCESAPALAVVPIDDFVCITITSIDDPLAGDMTSLYPNPASDQVSITSSQQMERITIVNYVGQMVYESELSGEQHLTLNTGSYEAGVYVVKINTANGVVTKRMIISR